MKTRTILFNAVLAAIIVLPSVSSAYVEKSGVIGTQTWVGGETYYISSRVHVRGTLTIEPGAIIKFNDLGSINGIWVEYGGTVIAQGTPDKYIVFTSENDNTIGETIPGSSGAPARGNWGTGLFILETASPNTVVEYCIMKYGGRGIAVVRVDMNNPIRHNIIQEQNSFCVMFYDGASGELFNNLLVNGREGSVAGRNAEVILRNNTLDGGTYGVYFWHGYWVSDPNVITLFDNIISNCGTGIVKSDIQTSNYNAYYNNGVDVSGFTKGPNSVDLTENPYVGTGIDGWRIEQDVAVVDGGSQSAVSAGLDAFSTSLDLSRDTGPVDIGYHYPADADGDGIKDLVDGEFVSGAFVDESSVYSDNFTDEHLGGTSFGFIVSRTNVTVTVVEEANPQGLRVAAIGGTGNARVRSCDNPKAIKLTSGDEIVITCSALTVRVLVGPVEIELSEEAIIIVPTGATVTVTELGGEQFEIKNSSPGGTPPVLIEIRDETIEVAPGESYVVCLVMPVIIDIKPRSCPNPFNIKWLENIDKGNKNDHAMSKKGGVLPAALVGTDDFDVNDIDVSTLRLEGIVPLRTGYEDVSRPVTGDDECACTTGGPDGILDLTMKFSRLEFAGLLESAVHGDVVKLVLTGALIDGTPFEASDCITILSKHPEPKIEEANEGEETKLGPAVPNPFNPSTMITYEIKEPVHVRLQIFNVQGRLVRTLVDSKRNPGKHDAIWNGLDDVGRPAVSGIYFYRLVAGDFVQTKKMVLLR